MCLRSALEWLLDAREGGRDLDRMLFSETGRLDELIGNPKAYGKMFVDMFSEERAPHYTTSIDAALELLPDGAQHRISNIKNGLRGGFAEIWVAHPPAMSFPTVFEAFESTPEDRKPIALALCIAAIKARIRMRELDERRER
jgi:hypothetical protein